MCAREAEKRENSILDLEIIVLALTSMLKGDFGGLGTMNSPPAVYRRAGSFSVGADVSIMFLGGGDGEDEMKNGDGE